MQTARRSAQTFLILVALLLSGALLAVSASRKTQMSLPLTGIQGDQAPMPPSPDDWCRKIDNQRLQQEVTRARTFLEEGVGENLVDWRYLRRALKHTGVQVTGPEDSYWLRTLEGLYSGCP